MIKVRKTAAVLLSIVLAVSAMAMATLPVAAADPYATNAYEILHGNKANGDGTPTGRYITLAAVVGKTYTFSAIYMPIDGPGFELSLTNGSKVVLMNGDTAVGGAVYDPKTLAVSYTFVAKSNRITVTLTSVKLGDINKAQIANPILTEEVSGAVSEMDTSVGWKECGAYWNNWPATVTALEKITRPLTPKQINLCFKSNAHDGNQPYYELPLSANVGVSYTLRMDYARISGPGFDVLLKDGTGIYTLMNRGIANEAIGASYDSLGSELSFSFTASDESPSLLLRCAVIKDNNTAQIGEIRLEDNHTDTVLTPKLGAEWLLRFSYNAWPYSISDIEAVQKDCIHRYEDACDVVCNSCGTVRTPPHTYTNPYDTDCNICAKKREPVNPYVTNVYQLRVRKKAEGDTPGAKQEFPTVVGKTYTFEAIYQPISGPGYHVFFENGSSVTLMEGATVVNENATYDPVTLKLSYTFSAADKKVAVGFASANNGDDNTAKVGYPILIEQETQAFTTMNSANAWPLFAAWNAYPSSVTVAQSIEPSVFADMTVNGATLFPAYNDLITEYTVTVPAGTASLDLLLTPQAGTTYEVLNNGNFTDDRYHYVQVIANPQGQDRRVGYTICVYVEPPAPERPNGRLEGVFVELGDGAVLDADPEKGRLSVLPGTALSDVMIDLPLFDGVTYVCCDEQRDYIPPAYYDVATIRDGFCLQMVKDGVVLDEWVFAVKSNLTVNPDATPDGTSMAQVGIVGMDAATKTVTVRDGALLKPIADLLPVMTDLRFVFCDADGAPIAADDYATAVLGEGYTVQLIKKDIPIATWRFAVAAPTCRTHVYDADCDITCNTCGETRETDHVLEGGVCTVCRKQIKTYVFHITVERDGALVTYVITVTVQLPTAAHIPGDINGDGSVNNRDTMFLTRYLNEWDVTVDRTALDVNGDGFVNNRDTMSLTRYLNEWDVTIV